MKETSKTNTRKPKSRVGMTIIVLLILISQLLASYWTTPRARARNNVVPEAQKEHFAKQIASHYSMGPFQASLEMKESTDFLLTPTMLVQEALSSHIVMTYPTE